MSRTSGLGPFLTYIILHIIDVKKKKFKHNDALDLTPCKQISTIRRSLVLRRRLRLISRMQRLQHLFPAKPFILWGEVPTHNAKNGDGAKDHASKIEAVGIHREVERGDHYCENQPIE